MQTEIIKYSLADRGRKYRGKDRHFNIAAVVAAINSPATQERVRKRDMLGYYGHWPRVKFGMNPSEGGLESGIPSVVEPALVTTYLHANSDGTIEHRAEFLQTEAGKVAERLYESRVGGFSSAIIDNSLHTEFFGFDYVNEPNYSTNRGWTLDSVSGQYLDSAGNTVTDTDVEAAAYAEQISTIKALLDSVTAERAMYEQTVEALRKENDGLIDELTKKKAAEEEETLDSVIMTAGKNEYERMKEDAAAFDSVANLPKLRETEKDEKVSVSVDNDPYLSRLANRFC